MPIITGHDPAYKGHGKPIKASLEILVYSSRYNFCFCPTICVLCVSCYAYLFVLSYFYVEYMHRIESRKELVVAIFPTFAVSTLTPPLRTSDIVICATTVTYFSFSKPQFPRAKPKGLRDRHRVYHIR